MKRYLLTLSMFGVLLFAGCSSSEQTTNLTAEERFQNAKAMFDNEDYLQAINEFTIVTLQYQGSAVAGDAQFYLAECRFRRREFLLAGFEYSVLKRSMPASPHVPESQYKLGLSYYNLSPMSRLDQQYARKAIDELQAFVEYYPANPLAEDAESKIRELTTRLAKKEYETAQLYSTMESYKSAIFYFDQVIEKYHDTEFGPLSYMGKAEAQMLRNKYQDALGTVNTFLEKYPNSVMRNQIEKLKKDIESEVNRPS